MSSTIKVDNLVNQSGDNDSGLDLSTNDQVIIKTANTTALTVNASQKVGIGTSSPTGKLEINGSDGALFAMRTTGDTSGQVMGTQYLNNSGAVTAQTFATGDSSSSSIFRIKAIGSIDLIGGDIGVTGASPDFRIDSSGNLLINNTGASPLNSGRVRIYNDTAQDALKTYQATSGTTALWSRIDHTASYFAVFNYNGSTVGTITTNGSATAYNTSSDHRLKENVTADWDATTRLKQLNPVRFNFIADADTTVDGFLAHEVQSVVPEAITGTHNEVDADGNPVYQGIDQAKLVPLLVKTIQELEARITALENA